MKRCQISLGELQIISGPKPVICSDFTLRYSYNVRYCVYKSKALMVRIGHKKLLGQRGTHDRLKVPETILLRFVLSPETPHWTKKAVIERTQRQRQIWTDSVKHMCGIRRNMATYFMQDLQRQRVFMGHNAAGPSIDVKPSEGCKSFNTTCSWSSVPLLVELWCTERLYDDLPHTRSEELLPRKDRQHCDPWPFNPTQTSDRCGPSVLNLEHKHCS